VLFRSSTAKSEKDEKNAQKNDQFFAT